MTFQDLGVINPILKALKSEGYTTPTPIQAQSIPVLLKGNDLLGCAQTGTGKTAAFAIPILQQLFLDKGDSRGNRNIKALIVSPTRELAIQINESFKAYGKYTGLRSAVIFGGVKQGQQVRTLKQGIDILIATPGRLLDLMNQGYIDLATVEYCVLDEADRMLDMGFIHDIRKIIASLPTQRQSLFFSATMPPDIVKLSNKMLGNPETVTIAPEVTTAERVEQGIYYVAKKGKADLLLHLLKEGNFHSTLVFSRTKHGANKIVKILSKAGIKSDAIHGNKSQAARQKALGNFKKGKIHVLVATDIAARGIDVDDLSHVINYDMPNEPETYVHRIGRTGRAGSTGMALSFCDKEERAYLRDIQKLIDKKIPIIDNHPFPEFVKETVAQTGGNQGQAPGKKPGGKSGGSQHWRKKRNAQRKSGKKKSHFTSKHHSS